MAKRRPARTARAAAAQVLSQVTQQQHSLNAPLKQAKQQIPANETALCQQLCYGVLRHYFELHAIAQQLLSKPLKKKDSDVHALLLCGLYQLKHMRLPEHASLSETVNACAQFNKPWAKGLINGCLRHYQRHQSEIEAKIHQDSASLYNHPDWLLKAIKQDWPEQADAIFEANNQQPPLFLRVNQQHHSTQQYLAQLSAEAISAEPVNAVSHAILLDSARDVADIPGFQQGQVSVQDAAAQWATELLNIAPQQRILDACAAPGGKTGHILEQAPGNHVTAIDIDEGRLQQVQQNLDRLQLNANLIAADAADTTQWWDGQKFDRILIDAPCSGTGVIRRHPDIKLLRRPSDIPALVEKQQQLLENLWPLLNTGGIMVYTTCSILKQENEQQIMGFLAQHPEALEIEPITAPAKRRTVGYQRLPGDNELDGFYYACLQHR